MVGKNELDQMRDDAYLINVARGQVIDEGALIAALQAGRFAGVGLDVAEVEPLPASSPLWEMPNVSITPHVGAQAHDRVDSTVDFFCTNLKRYEADQSLLNLVDKRLGFPRPEHRAT
jgi:D-3-phosphoglycerate dehydrogenase